MERKFGHHLTDIDRRLVESADTETLPIEFAKVLNLAKGYTALLMETYSRVRDFAESRMEDVKKENLPEFLDFGNQT